MGKALTVRGELGSWYGHARVDGEELGRLASYRREAAGHERKVAGMWEPLIFGVTPPRGPIEDLRVGPPYLCDLELEAGYEPTLSQGAIDVDHVVEVTLTRIDVDADRPLWRDTLRGRLVECTYARDTSRWTMRFQGTELPTRLAL